MGKRKKKAGGRRKKKAARKQSAKAPAKKKRRKATRRMKAVAVVPPPEEEKAPPEVAAPPEEAPPRQQAATIAPPAEEKPLERAEESSPEQPPVPARAEQKELPFDVAAPPNEGIGAEVEAIAAPPEKEKAPPGGEPGIEEAAVEAPRAGEEPAAGQAAVAEGRRSGDEETMTAAPPVEAPPEHGPRRRTTAIVLAAPVEELVARARAQAEGDPAGALLTYAELARTGSLSKEVALEAAELARLQEDAELEAEFFVQAVLADPSDAELRRKAYEKARESGELWASSRALQVAVESGESEAIKAHRELVADAVEEALDLLTLAAVGLARGRDISLARKIFSLLLSEDLNRAYLTVEGASSVFTLEGRSRYRASSRRGRDLLVEDVASGTARLSFRCRGAGTAERARRQAGRLLVKLAEALFSGAQVSMRAGDELARKLSKALGREMEFSQYWPMPDGTLQVILRTAPGDLQTLTLTEGRASIEDPAGRSEDLGIETGAKDLSRARERYVRVREGTEKLEEGETGEAQACAHRALELDPLGAEPNFLMGKVHSARGEWGKAVERLRTAADADPDSAVILNELGLALMRAGKHAEAANAFSAAYEYDMRDEYRGHLIEAWMLAGNVARAEKELGRLKRKVGEQPDALAQLAHIQLHSDVEKAERMLRRALALDKKCGLAFVGLARIACREKALDEAAYYVERALATRKPDIVPRLKAEADMEPLRVAGKLDELLAKAISEE